MKASSILCGFRSGSDTEPKFLIGSISRGFSLAPSSQPPSITGLRGNSALPCPRPAGRCRELSPCITMQILRWMRPREAPGPGSSSRTPRPLRAAQPSTRRPLSVLPGGLGVHRPGIPLPPPLQPRSGSQGAANSWCGASPPRDTHCWKPRKVTRLKALPCFRPLFSNACRIKGRGCIHECICMYISI